MCAYQHDEKPGMILSIAKNKCPRCRRGDLYKNKGSFRIKGLMAMNDHCPVCGQPFDMEPGFYYGTNMISYALAVVFSILSFIEKRWNIEPLGSRDKNADPLTNALIFK